jgi:hypothetical protein
LVYDTIIRTPKIPLPYPPDTKAFLYYHISPEKTRLAGELRLRVTSSDDAASFESGSDLLGTNGQPWSRPLSSLPKYYFPLYENLREEGFVPDDLDRVLPSNNLRYNQSRLCLYTLNDTFIVDFSHIGSFFYIVTEKDVERMPFFQIFWDNREECKSAPYTGAHTNLYRHLLLLLY